MEKLIRDLFHINDMYESSLKEITDFALEIAIANTNSEIGFITFTNGDSTKLSNNSWSAKVMKQCEVLDQPFCINNGGIWTEVFKTGLPQIINNYEHLQNPLKKGIPQGHVQIKKVLNFPFKVADKIVMLLGLANKQDDYDELDVKKIALLMEGLWKHISRRQEKNNIESFFKNIIDLLPVGVFWKNDESKYLGCNKYHADFSGLTPNEIIGKTDHELVWTINADKYISDDKMVINGKSLLNFEETINTHDKIINVLTSKVPFVENGKTIGVLGCWRDISHIKKLIDEVKQSNTELEQFAYIASHDLKSPLRAIHNLTTWIIEDLSENKNISQHIDLLQNRIKRMETLIDGLLEYSRIGKTHKEISSVNLNELLEEIKQDFNGSKNKNIHVTISNMPIIKINKNRVQQIFYNLIDNSIKHHRDISDVKINISCQENLYEYVFCVEDNGPGIDPKYHDKIFEIFQTLRPKDEIEGTGIGLSIVKKIIEENHGKIWVSSSLGNGAKFYFIIHK